MTRRSHALALSLLLLAACPSAATLVEDLSIEEMVQRADCVVLGRVVHVSFEAEPGRSQIFTRVRIHVERCCKEDARGMDVRRTVEMRFEGGSAGGITTEVDGMPRFGVGDRVLVFLFRNQGEDAFRPLGLSLGCFRSCRGERDGRPVLRRDLTGLSLLRRRADGEYETVQGEPDPDRPHAPFVHQIESIARRSR